MLLEMTFVVVVSLFQEAFFNQLLSKHQRYQIKYDLSNFHFSEKI